MYVGYQMYAVNVYNQKAILGWPSICHLCHAKYKINVIIFACDRGETTFKRFLLNVVRVHLFEGRKLDYAIKKYIWYIGSHAESFFYINRRNLSAQG